MSVIKQAMGLQVTADGLDPIVAKSAKFHKNMTEGARAASQTKAYAAAKQESQDYGVTRSLRPGGTGASARDFAQEAQGLGGLVRLYATYAANIFAVGAAFRALSNAMDTSNMVRGLDQLGAASGTALGSLAKNLTKTTDGAISLRESMEAVAKASSSGMSSENILRMGKVAKTASQALGVDMADAVNRITRGITKLEPELLDEIGIFTRVDSATKEYAKSVGKSADALTDFEKRMAFANAVLAEGERKFGAIELDTNPYTKLLATIKDVSQAGLELVNKVIAPLVGFLAQSPTALTAVLATIGTLLVKQALPAIGEFKAGLENAASKARDKAIEKTKEAEEAKTKLIALASKRREELADTELYKVIETQKRITETYKQGQHKNTNIYKLLDSDFADRSAKNLKEIDDLNAKVLSKKAELERGLARLENNGGDPKAIEALRNKIELHTQAIDTAKRYSDAEGKLSETIADSSKKSLTHAANIKIAEKAQATAAKQTIIANAGYNASLLGIRDSYKIMKEEIAKSGLALSSFQKGMLTARGAVSIAAGAVSTLGAAMQGAFMWIGLIVTAIGILDSVFSGASKEVDSFNNSVESLTAASDTLSKTLETISKNNPFSTGSLQAQATAMLEVSTSFDTLTSSANKALNALSNSTWSRFKDNVSSLFGGGVQNNFEESLANTILNAVQNLDNAPIESELRKKLEGILNIKDVGNFKQLEKALQNLDPKSETVRKISKALKDAAIEAGNAASKSAEFASAFKESEEAYKAFTKQFQVNDPLSTFATKSLVALSKLQESLNGPTEQSLDNLLKLTEDIGKNPIFGPEQTLLINSYQDELKGLNSTLQAQLEIRRNLAAEQEKENKERKSASIGLRLANADPKNIQQNNIINDSYTNTENQRLLNKAISAADTIMAKSKARVAEIAGDIAKVIPSGLQTSLGYIEKGIVAAMAKGSTIFLQSVYSKISDIPELASREGELKKQEIAVEEESIRASMSLATQLKLNAAVTEKLTAQMALEKATEQDEKYGTEETGKAKASAEKDFKQASDKLELIRKIAANPIAGIRELNNALGTAGDSLGKYAADLGAFAQEVSGFRVQLNKLGQDRKTIDFDTTLKTISAITAQEKQRLDFRGKSLTEEQKLLDISKKDLGYTSTELASRQEILDKKQASVAFDKEMLSINDAYTQKLAVASILLKEASTEQNTERRNKLNADAQAIINSAVLVYNNEKTTAENVKQNSELEATRRKLEQVNTLARERLAIEQKAKDLISENLMRQQEAELEIQDIKLQTFIDTTNLSEQEKGRLQMEQNTRRLLYEADKKQYEAKKKYDKDIAEAQKSYTEENAYESEKLIKAIMDGYEKEKQQIQQVTDLKIMSIRKVFEAQEQLKLQNAITDAVVTALTKGGKEGAKVLRNFIVEEMRRKITVQVQAQVRTSNIGKVASAATDFTSTVMAGYNSYNFGGGLIDGLNTLGDNLVTVFPELGMKIQDLGVSLGGYESALNTVGVGISALTSALDGDYGAALGEVVGYYVAGPVGAAVGKFLGSALGLTDDSGTYHTGGAGSYSSTQGVRTGASVEQSLNFNLEGNINEQVETASANAAKTLVAIFDGIATTFGQEAGYYAATAFADDTSKDGAWGALMVKLGDKVLIDWGKGVDKWPGREFADGEAGQKEYLNALAKDTVQVLKDMDLPKWADDILASIGDSPTFEKLQVAITQIEALNSVFETFSGALGWTREEIEGMIGPLGGVQSSAQKLGFYYENFYSEQEKLAYSTKSLKDKFSEIGKEMPETREGFRAMVEAAKAAGDEALVAKILNLAPAFANLTPALEDAADSIANLFETAREQLNLTADGLAGIFRNVLDTATSAGEAQSMAAAEFEKSVYTGLQNVMITGVSQMLYDAVIAPMANNLVGASVSAATSVASGGVVSGSAVASGGILAGNELAKIVADAKIYIANMAAIMNDPGVRELISQASGAAGSAAGQMWTATPTQYRPTTTSVSYGGGSNDSSKPEQNAYEKLMEQLVDRLAELNRSIEEANANERTRKGQTAQRLARERESFLASDEYKEAYGIASAENTRKQKLATNYENASSYYKRIADSYSKWGATDAANWMLEYSNLYKEKAASLRLEVANFVDPILAAFDENQRKEIELDTLEERNELTNELTDLMMTGAEATRAWIDGLYESNQELGMQLAVMRELKPLLQEEAGLRVQLARASGNEELAKRLEREIAFQDLLTEEARAQWDRNRALEEEIQNLETLAGLKDEYGSLEIQKLQALGRTQEALALQRQKDIEGMDAASIAQYDRNKALEEEIRIIEVMKEVKNQEVELLRLQGKEEEALALERSLQLAGMDPLLQSNQLLIWQYEDMQIAAEKARQKTEMQVRILELLGRSEEATAISRAMQLAEMDASLRPMQEYIWLLEDEAKAKQELQQALEKEINTLQGVADKTKGFIKSLADLKQSLQVSDVLTPQQRYAEAKRQFFENSALIATVPTTEEGVAAREEALGNFTSLANKLLEESRTVNSSSSLYFEDYTNIMALIDSTSSALEDQLTDTEKMIESMKSQVTLLTGIETAVKSIPDATAALNSIRDKLALAQDYTAMYPEYALPLATTATETAPSVSPTTSTTTTETIPETTNAQLLIELRAVKEELKQLRAQQHKETGDLINATYDSEMRGADKVSTTIVNTAKMTSWTSAVTTGATLA